MGNVLTQLDRLPDETSLALATRIRFTLDAIRARGAKRILDMGCGTGEQLTAYIARHCPEATILGVDPDKITIDMARRRFAELTNLSFQYEMPVGVKYDAIIASEVLEHVENPYQFIELLTSRLNRNGVLILTVPNGYGVSEIMAMLESLLTITKIWPAILKAKSSLLGTAVHGNTQKTDTLAISPHINFFSYNRIMTVFRRAGVKVTRYQGRMFLHHFIFTSILNRSKSLAALNVKLGKLLPPGFVSDWMFVARQKANAGFEKRIYKRNLLETLRGYLNQKVG